MGISVGHIIEALSLLGGEAHLKDIEQMVVKIAPLPHPKEPQASIRARIQERCAETASYLQRENLFESVYGVQEKKGILAVAGRPSQSLKP
jgi:hypothetical protein